MSKFPTIVADPPWPYPSPGAGPLQSSPSHRPQSWDQPLSGVGSAVRYGAMSLEDICALNPPAADDAHLYLWTTNAFMVEAHEVARAWGFDQKTILTWTKVHKKDPAKVSRKTGYYFRGATEHCLFCVRGSLKLQTAEALPTAFLWPRLPHSVKPDEFYAVVEKASPGPYLEMFARRTRLGPWHYWGDESLQTVEIGLTA